MEGLNRAWERSDRTTQSYTAEGGAAKQTGAAAPGSVPERRNPSLRGPNVGASLFGYFFGVWKKCLAVRAKPPAAAPQKPDIHPNQPEPGRPTGRQGTKKRGNRSRPKMPCVPIKSRRTHLRRLCASFQIKKTNPAKNSTKSPTVRTPANTTLSKNMTDLPALLCFAAMDSN